jgi:molecular chaperone GrpE (heat shock protein)
MNNLFSNPIVIVILALVVLFIFAFLYFLTRKSGGQPTGPDKFEELYRKISEDIKYAVAPKHIELSLGVNDLVDLAVEIWRMDQRLVKSMSALPDNQQKGLQISIEKLKRYVGKYDIEILDYTNQKFNDGLNLDILSVEKDPSLPSPIVKETIEPTILVKGQVVRKAKIILLTNQ